MTNTTGRRHRAARLRDSWKAPWFAPPSPVTAIFAGLLPIDLARRFPDLYTVDERQDEASLNAHEAEFLADRWQLRGSLPAITVVDTRDDAAERLQFQFLDQAQVTSGTLWFRWLLMVEEYGEMEISIRQRHLAAANYGTLTISALGALWVTDDNGTTALAANGTVRLDEERRAAMVSNLLVVLCGDRSTQPIVNTGSLY